MSSTLAQMLVLETNFPPFSVPMPYFLGLSSSSRNGEYNQHGTYLQQQKGQVPPPPQELITWRVTFLGYCIIYLPELPGANLSLKSLNDLAIIDDLPQPPSPWIA